MIQIIYHIIVIYLTLNLMWLIIARKNSGTNWERR
jgi:hypothetical protein